MLGFLRRVGLDSHGEFPLEGPVGLAAIWETPWLNDSIGVTMMALGWILILRKCNAEGGFYRKIILPISQASYGMYLCHLLLLVMVSAWLRDTLKLGAEGVLGLWTTPVQILSTACISYVIVALACVLFRRLARIGKIVIG